MERFDVLKKLQNKFQELKLEINKVSTEKSLDESATFHLEFYYQLHSLQELAHLEILCKQFYDASSPDERATAEKALVNFVHAPDCLPTCRLLLERRDSSYAQLLAATTLTKLVSRNPQTLTLQQRIDIRNYVLTYLATCPKLANFVTQALVQLFARITKIGWFETYKKDHVFRNLVSQLSGFLQGSVEYCVIGIQLLSQVTCEINQISEVSLKTHITGAEANKSLTKQRKTAISFRDSELFEIFQLSCDLLRRALESWKSPSFKDEAEHNLMSCLLRLAYNCISFDFIGTSPDESSDDLCTVQIPTSWRPAFLDFNSLQLFFDLYHCLTPSLSSQALLCIVQIASVRRTLFNNEERGKYLGQLVSGIKSILENPQKLSDANNYHEFCRLLARLKTNYQLGELVRVESYPDTIRLIAKFTVTSLQMWQFAPNSIHYLLSLWQRMVASVPYVKALEPHLLETYTPEVTQAFITSRLESVSIIMREGLEDPLDDLGMVQQQLDQMSIIGRCEYEKTCSLLVQLFDQAAQRYQELLTSVSAPSIDVQIQEGQLTWLVYIIAAAIGGRVSFNTADEYDAMDGELICRVLQLMNLTDNRISQGGCEKLELAMIYFFEQFRKIYVGDQIQRTSKVYKRLSEVLGVSDESMVLSVFIRKILTNLKYWSRSEQVINRTLQLLSDLSVGYTSVRKLVKLDEVQFMLNNHTSEHFPFLGSGMQIADLRCRSVFYTALGRLLLINLGEDEDKFEQFMMPLTATFESIGNALAGAESGVFNESETKKQLIGLARDLRGLAFAFNSKISYMMLFEWIYPTYTPILHRAIEMWYHDPAVTTPVLKLFAEIVVNRSQRLQFDVSSPNGILLFREASKIIVTYGSRVLTLTSIPKDQVYKMNPMCISQVIQLFPDFSEVYSVMTRLKVEENEKFPYKKLLSISICFSMLKFALCGGYVNFGVFRFYGDVCLDDALNTFVKMLLSIPQSDLLHYPKLSQTYYVLLECLAQDHMDFLSKLEPNLFLYILSSISEGLSSSDTMVCAGCCAALDHLVTYIFKKVSRTGRKRRQSGPEQHEEETCLMVLKQHPEILQQMLSTNLNIVIFEECRNQWSMSRPLLGLILLNEEYFSQLRQSIISNQLPDKQVVMAQWFDSLMEGIERNLQTKNRERFTQNLSVFRRDVNDSLKDEYKDEKIPNNEPLKILNKDNKFSLSYLKQMFRVDK